MRKEEIMTFEKEKKYENELAKIILKFGIIPTEVGNRYRDHWIVEKIADEEKRGGAEIGCLCVEARDGASNPIDFSVYKYANFVGSSEDNFDCTYRYYYFRPLEATEAAEEP
jgi:hypothetical protein